MQALVVLFIVLFKLRSKLNAARAPTWEKRDQGAMKGNGAI